MRSATRFAFLFVLCVLTGCDLFGSEKDDGVPPTLVEGEYDARYVARFEDGGEIRGRLFCVFFGERKIWDCQPRVGQPVTAGGSCQINSKDLVLRDENVKRANFNWGLFPDGTYDYELDGDTLTLTQHGSPGVPDAYTRSYHRIVPVRRDTSEYEYLSKRSADEQKTSSFYPSQ
jgi:hypothetical protein